MQNTIRLLDESAFTSIHLFDRKSRANYFEMMEVALKNLSEVYDGKGAVKMEIHKDVKV